MTDASLTWTEANQRYLMAALEVLRGRLRSGVSNQWSVISDQWSEVGGQGLGSMAEMRAAMPAPPALERVAELFGLSAFERDVLLLCAGVELAGDMADLCAAVQQDAASTYPTFALALATLPDAHWSALNPCGALRYWRLIELGSGSSLVHNRLRIDERVLHTLVGVEHLDEHLVGYVRKPALAGPGDMVSQASAEVASTAERIAALWRQAEGEVPVIQLCGSDSASHYAIAAAAAAQAGWQLYVMPASVLPVVPHDLEMLIRLWQREAALSNSALLLDCHEAGASDPAREPVIERFSAEVGGVLIVSSQQRRQTRLRPMITFDVARPTAAEQRRLWQQALDGATAHPFQGMLNGQQDAGDFLPRLATHFDLTPTAIHAAANRALAEYSGDQRAAVGAQGLRPEPAKQPDLGELLWQACRQQARPRLDDLALRIEPVAAWADLVLPERQERILHAIAAQVRHRLQVYEAWGFAARSPRGLGISALFAGPSGTGKTLAAEVLANELRLDLYHIDLSQVVSKYIGETEKNLSRVFDAAEAGGAILFFDEADALFGKRTEVKDSHDRYANIEVSYLLQRMEAYRGLAILTTNMKQALDDAFLRRIRFIVHFPFPDAAGRAQIWRRIFPAETPTDGLDPARLSRLNVTGGSIRNIALNAAFLAADAGQPVGMQHVLEAARVEYAKLERPLTDAETRGWI